jgi:NADH-quinone oxidoreductase subunit J
LLTVVVVTIDKITGKPSSTGALDSGPDVNRLGEFLFTKYAFAFEITAVLLTIAVVGAVVMSRRPKADAEAIVEAESEVAR